MTIIRYETAERVTVLEIMLDPFEVAEIIRQKMFPGVPLPERDERFEAAMKISQGAKHERAKRKSI